MANEQMIDMMSERTTNSIARFLCFFLKWIPESAKPKKFKAPEIDIKGANDESP